MSRQYGVNVSNRFVLNLEDEDASDPDEIIAKSTNLQQLKKPTKAIAGDKPKQQKQVSSNTLPSVRPGIGTQSQLGEAKDLGEKQDQQPTQLKKTSPGWMTVTGHTRHSRSTKQRDNKSVSESVEDANKKNEQLSLHEGRLEIIPRRGRGGGAPRFFRGNTRKGDTQTHRGKREFDRLSGSNKSGVKPVEKRDGGGAHNWGKPVGEVEFPDTEERSSDEGTAPSEHKEESTHEKDKKDDKSMTLDEWKRKQEKRNIPAFNLRKPGEGETEKWNDTYILKKKEKEDEHEEEEEEEANSKKGKQKQHLDPSLLFAEMKIGSSSAKTAKKNLSAAKPQVSNLKSSSDSAGKHEAPKMDDFDDFPKL